ncbi:lysylphosphatidylglycerol synthase domain-containing protein [Mycobacterium hubeiense]|uniref:lysylphosphatidylglycerol synthase domain-containing protein n=1 Tax=Mycobacterium hubeiense TaxID=1867256 RepID=UPI0018ED9053|nr:lysylphosphatidylglycerol synthase domain-containing protein [Mycobacterium sp. QGD 101]
MGRRIRTVAGLVILAIAVWYLARVLDREALAALGRVLRSLVDAPLGLTLALTCYAAAFVLRALAWRATLPGLSAGQSWAALHVSLLGNHVLPLRLGEALRVTSVLRRTDLEARPVIASAVTMRAADFLAVAGLAVIAVPGLMPRLVGPWWWVFAAVAAVAVVAGLVWSMRLAAGGAQVRLPPLPACAAVVAAWILESTVVYEIARAAGHPLTLTEAVAVTAVTIVAQAFAVTPGGIGTYEAAATAAMVAIGVPAGPAFAIALTTHAVKTIYALAVGGVALVVPAPSYWGRWRLPRELPQVPPPIPVAPDAPVVAFLPVHNEEATVGGVVAGLFAQDLGRRLVVLVIDDGSTDSSAARAQAAGAVVVAQPRNLGLGAAVRRGLAEAMEYRPAAVLYLDADGEYAPSDAAAVLAPVLAGEADYVVGSRFSGEIGRMLPHRRFGNQVLTLWVRWLTRRRDLTDGQSGYRAFRPAAAAAAEIVHDYNYAQVLTLDLLAKGFRYAEVPITYSFRDSGTSFVRLGRYLSHVIPAVHRELNSPQADVG